jgi:hyperosmotically inducible periplasmic protein
VDVKSKFAAIVLAMGLAGATMVSAKAPTPDTLENKVRHELVMLPRMNLLFGDLSFRVDGGVVTLFGEVTQPVMKDDAGRAVKRIEGVTRVDNQVEVLPLSPMDDGIRVREARAVLSGPLFRYAMGTQPSIHIIVKNGNVTLTGIVSNASDSQIAYMRANGVPGVFSVKNELRVVK